MMVRRKAREQARKNEDESVKNEVNMEWERRKDEFIVHTNDENPLAERTPGQIPVCVNDLLKLGTSWC